MNSPVFNVPLVRDLYEQGLFMQAYRQIEACLPLQNVQGTAERLMAARLAGNLGAPRLAAWLMLRAYRAAPNDPDARYYYARTRLERAGPLAVWRLLRRCDDMPDASSEQRAQWLSLHGLVAGTFRDFDTAEIWFDRAEQCAPNDPWVWIERAVVMEYADRYDEALRLARRVLETRPWYRPGVQSAAHLLQLMGRDDEALELLMEAAQRIESNVVVWQLVGQLLEKERHAEAGEWLDRFVALSPLAEKEVEQSVAGVRSDISCFMGDLPAAIRWAKQADLPFFDRVAARMEAATAQDRRVLLPVGFIRQHNMTCAPATLSAISRFWEMPADHLSVAEAICYDGTPWHSERRWAEENGWATREFTVTWESATALLDRGVPFTLTTVAPGFAHLQAVIGYDSRRGTILIRDPFFRHTGEAIAEELFRALSASGPRGMALVPRAQATLLDDLPLPDASLYDRLYAVQRALTEYRREEAQAAYNAMEQAAPEHLLTLGARRALAAYDSDINGVLAAVETLQARFPQDANYQLARLSCLGELARREERLAILQEICARRRPKDGEEKARRNGRDEDEEVEPLFWQQYAQELCLDAREADRAMRLLHRAIRYRPSDPHNLRILAGILWERQEREEALALYRFAACLEVTNEHLAASYFLAARYMKQTEQALALLQNRFRRLGARSNQPARTLFNALNDLDRTPEAFAVLEEALKLRPEDGELMLFAAEKRAGLGQFEPAEALLTAAEGRASRADWLRAAARLASARGETARALTLWQEVLATEPFALDAHEAAALLLGQTEGPAAARRHLEQAAERFPNNFALRRMLAEWLRNEEDPGAQEAVLRRMIEINEADAWTRRELSAVLSRQRRHEEALAEAELACRLDPSNSFSFSIRGDAHAAAGRLDAARADYLAAIRLAADNDYALDRLLSLSDTPAAKREALLAIEAELERQTLYGDSLLTFRRLAHNVLTPEEVYRMLRQALTTRMDLWHAWSAMTFQLLSMDRLTEAEKTAAAAAARFPLLPQMWLDLAVARRARGDSAGEQEALRQALDIAPGFGPAVRQFADACERAGDFAQSRRMLEAAVARDGLDAENRAALAYVLHAMGEKEEAVACLRALLRQAPGFEWAWERLREWCAELEREDEAVEAAREMTQRRPGSAVSWLLLAQMLSGVEALPERLAALERAVALDPRCFDAYELRARILAEAGRFEEAQAACRLPDGQPAPASLRACAARIEAARGDLSAAIVVMRAIVESDPGFRDGWIQLAQWYEETENYDEGEKVAQRLVALAPQDSLGYGLLGDLRQRRGDRAGAKEAFRRAMTLSPDYVFAGASLFDMLLEDGDLEGAARTLEVMRPHMNDGMGPAYGVRLAARRADLSAATQCLGELCSGPEERGYALRLALDTMLEANWGQQAEGVLDQALAAPDARPELGYCWVYCHTRRGLWDCEARVVSLFGRGEIGVRASNAYINALVAATMRPALYHFLQAHGGYLRADGSTWGSVGYALHTLGDTAAAIDWMSDWRKRADAEPWALVNLAESLRCRGNEAASSSVSRHAMTLPRDHGSPFHACWLASDAAMAGDTKQARRWLAEAEAENLSAYYAVLRQIAMSLAAVLEAAPAQRRRLYARERQSLATAWAAQKADTAPKHAHEQQLLRKTYRRAVLRLAQAAKSLPAALAGLVDLARG